MDESKVWQVLVAFVGGTIAWFKWYMQKFDTRIEKNSEATTENKYAIQAFNKRMDYQDEKLDSLVETNKIIIKLLTTRARKPK